MTDENIVMLSHTDGFFEGASDNAAGTAAMLGTAEYFAKMPKEKRRRTLLFVALVDHHSGDLSMRWLRDKRFQLAPEDRADREFRVRRCPGFGAGSPVGQQRLAKPGRDDAYGHRAGVMAVSASFASSCATSRLR